MIFTVYSLLINLQYDVHTVESGQGVHIPEVLLSTVFIMYFKNQVLRLSMCEANNNDKINYLFLKEWNVNNVFLYSMYKMHSYFSYQIIFLLSNKN